MTAEPAAANVLELVFYSRLLKPRWLMFLSRNQSLHRSLQYFYVFSTLYSIVSGHFHTCLQNRFRLSGNSVVGEF